MSLDVSIETITPEKAREYLAHNTHNRNVRPHRVANYAADMRAGSWLLNGEGIKFNTRGEIDDGQHRLLAIIEADVPVQMLVVRGVENAQHTMDTGLNRQFSDVLKLQGEDAAVVKAAIARSIFHWELGDRRFGGGRGRPSTNIQLLESFEKHKEWIESARHLLTKVSSSVYLPTSVSGALYFAFSQLDPEDAEYFFTRLVSDEGHRTGDPIFALRRALLSIRAETKGTRNLTYMAAITIKAWNVYRDGGEVQLLRFRPGGANPEKFPEPK